MKFEDFIIKPNKIEHEKWQIGKLISNEITENAIVFIFVSDYRGVNGTSDLKDFSEIRKIFYQLSALDFEIPICDLGDLISGKTLQDTHYILQEVLSACLYQNAIPIVIGGGQDLSYSLFYALNFHQKNINYTHISNRISMDKDGKEITEKNFLNKIFTTKNFSIKNFHLLGYQEFLNEVESVKLIKEVEFDVVRLSEMMYSTEKTEPFFRRANLVNLNCDAIESTADAFSVNPQVNGLNKREICAYTKEIGLSESLKSVGIFNYNITSKNTLNQQLMAEMLWYLVDGINIQKSHPKKREIETFWVMVDHKEFAFKRDVFSNLWYFGDNEDLKHCIPCSKEDYHMAKKGVLNPRFLK